MNGEAAVDPTGQRAARFSQGGQHAIYEKPLTPPGGVNWAPPSPQQQQQQLQQLQQQQQQLQAQFAAQQFAVSSPVAGKQHSPLAAAAYGLQQQGFPQATGYPTPPQSYSPTSYAFQQQAAFYQAQSPTAQLLQQQQQLYPRGFNPQQIYNFGAGAYGYPQANFGYSLSPQAAYAPYSMAGSGIGNVGGAGGGAGSKNRVPGGSCFIFHLPPSATDETLKQLFSEHGTVLNAYVAMDKQTNRSKGYGFVDYGSPEEANAAVLAMDKRPCGGKFLAVSIKK